MNDPIAMTVHPGGGLPPVWRRELIAEWLRTNGIDPELVYPGAPISVFTVPSPRSDDDEPWFIKVIAFTQLYATPDGRREYNFLTHEPVTFQRTVPLTTPFPADPTPGQEGSPHGKAQGQAAQEAPEVQVRPARQAPVPDRHKGQGSQRAGEGQPIRIEVDPEDHPLQGHEALPEPEEDRQEEVGDQ